MLENVSAFFERLEMGWQNILVLKYLCILMLKIKCYLVNPFMAVSTGAAPPNLILDLG